MVTNQIKYITTNYLGLLAVNFYKDRKKYTAQFLQKIEDYASGRRKALKPFTAAIDVVSLCDNLSRSLFIESLAHYAMEILRPELTVGFKSRLMKVVNVTH